jgi:hypothetical protein
MAIDQVEVLPWTEYPANWSLSLKENYQDVATAAAFFIETTKLDALNIEELTVDDAPDDYSKDHTQTLVDAINQISKNQKLISDKIDEILSITEASLINEEA